MPPAGQLGACIPPSLDSLAPPDDLTQRLELGCRYDVVVLTGSGADLELEAWGVRPWQNRAQRRFESGLRSDPLPTAIQDIWIQSTYYHNLNNTTPFYMRPYRPTGSSSDALIVTRRAVVTN